eukprot:13459810-Alexandrium_andersonii.AAC.1
MHAEAKQKLLGAEQLFDTAVALERVNTPARYIKKVQALAHLKIKNSLLRRARNMMWDIYTVLQKGRQRSEEVGRAAL